MTTENKNLFYLHELSDYKVADEYPDVRGWEIKDRDNRIIGKVDGLLVSKSAERVVYLDVEVDEEIIGVEHEIHTKAIDGVHEFLNKEGENHLIVPIGLVELDENEKLVRSNQITRETFASTRRFNKGASIARDYESAVYKGYLPESTETSADDNTDFYDRSGFNRR